MLLMVVSWSIIRGMQEGIVWAIVGGVWLDLLSALPFGTMATAMTVTCVLAGWLGGPLVQVNTLLPLTMAPVVTVIFNLTVVLLLEVLGVKQDWANLVTDIVVPLALLNSVAMVPLYGALYGISRRIQPDIRW